MVTDRNLTFFVFGNEARTTNQRMEVKAAIKALEQVSPGAEVNIYSDSQYLVSTMTRGWKRRKNLDLWQQIDALTAQRKVKFEWVKAHADSSQNNEVDRLANLMAKQAAQGEIIEAEGGNPLRNNPFTHIDESGAARMVDVSAKGETERTAIARGSVAMKPETLKLIKEKGIEKGDVLAVARVAGIMAAKKTSELIPMCHPLMLTSVQVELEPDEKASAIQITATVKTTGKTGVEMEALTAVSVAALTIYDMAKAVDRAMRIEGVRLVLKEGGKSGLFQGE